MSGLRPSACAALGWWGAALTLGLPSGPERTAGLSHPAGWPRRREPVDEAGLHDRRTLTSD